MGRRNKDEPVRYSSPWYDKWVVWWHDSGAATKKLLELIDKLKTELEKVPRHKGDPIDTVLQELQTYLPNPVEGPIK